MARMSLDLTFAALADPTRRAILARLMQGEATVTELVRPSALSQPTVTRHLDVLERAGLIERRRDHAFRRVSLRPAALAEAWQWLGRYEAFWAGSFDRLDALVRTLPLPEVPSMSVDSDRELTLTRDFPVPPAVLFLACSRPEHMRQWFGPVGYPLTLCEMDFRVGGRYRFAMTGPDGVQGPVFGGEYVAIEADRLIRYTNRFETPGAEEMVVTLSFEPVPGGARLTHHTRFASVAMKQHHVGYGYTQGVGSGLDQLAVLVTRMGAS